MPVDHDRGGWKDGAVRQAADGGSQTRETAAPSAGPDALAAVYDVVDPRLVDTGLGVLVGLEGQQLGHDQLVAGAGGHPEGFALLVPGRVLQQQVDHAHVAAPAGLHQAG